MSDGKLTGGWTDKNITISASPRGSICDLLGNCGYGSLVPLTPYDFAMLDGERNGVYTVKVTFGYETTSFKIYIEY